MATAEQILAADLNAATVIFGWSVGTGFLLVLVLCDVTSTTVTSTSSSQTSTTVSSTTFVSSTSTTVTSTTISKNHQRHKHHGFVHRHHQPDVCHGLDRGTGTGRAMATMPIYRRISSSWYMVFALTIPPATAAVALYTIHTCATLTWEAGILPLEMRFPPISFFGLRKGSPEQALYMRGFPCVAALFIASIVPVSSYLMDNVEPDKKDGAWTACWTSAVAFIGLAVHGAVPLHEDVLAMIHGKPESGDGVAQNIVHQLAAAVFFMLSLYHGFVVTRLLWSSARLPTGYARSGFLGKFSFAIKAVTLAAQLLPGFTGLLYHPATLSILGIKGLSLNEMDKGGLSQWWTVGCLIFFYLTYGFDLVLIGLFLASENEKKKGKVRAE